jgi:serine/threonine-protein kinase RsbW
MTVEFARTLSDGRAGFAALLDAIEALLESHGVPQPASAQILIAFDEIISNVLDHGGDATAPQVEVSLRIQDGRIDAEVVDDGKPFDPLAASPPDLDLDIDERPIGGLGIHLVRELMDGISYERDRGKNHLRISKTYLLE